MCGDTIPRRKADFTCELEGMEAAVGQLKAALFYFHDEKKFWYQLKNLLKSKTQAEYCWFFH